MVKKQKVNDKTLVSCPVNTDFTQVSKVVGAGHGFKFEIAGFGVGSDPVFLRIVGVTIKGELAQIGPGCSVHAVMKLDFIGP